MTIGTVETRFYEIAGAKNELLSQLDAVMTLTDPEVGTSLGLEVTEAIQIAARIDPLIGATTPDEMIEALRRKVESTEVVMDGVLSVMKNYPADVKAEILPNLQSRYEEVFNRLEEIGDIKTGNHSLETIREVVTKERVLNDAYSLVMAHA